MHETLTAREHTMNRYASIALAAVLAAGGVLIGGSMRPAISTAETSIHGCSHLHEESLDSISPSCGGTKLYWVAVITNLDGVPVSVKGTRGVKVFRQGDAYLVQFTRSPDLRNCAAVGSVGNGISTIVVTPLEAHRIFFVARERDGSTVTPRFFSVMVAC
jgi:hypothetical protein